MVMAGGQTLKNIKSDMFGKPNITNYIRDSFKNHLSAVIARLDHKKQQYQEVKDIK